MILLIIANTEANNKPHYGKIRQKQLFNRKERSCQQRRAGFLLTMALFPVKIEKNPFLYFYICCKWI